MQTAGIYPQLARKENCLSTCVLTSASQEYLLSGNLLIADGLLQEIGEVIGQNMVLLRRYQQLELLRIINC